MANLMQISTCLYLTYLYRRILELMAGQDTLLPGNSRHIAPKTFGEAWNQFSKSLAEISGHLEKHLDRR